jgi:hypothetical protein
MSTNSILFSPFRLGPNELKNRIVMAPMTRNRAGGEHSPYAGTAFAIVTAGRPGDTETRGETRVARGSKIQCEVRGAWCGSAGVRRNRSTWRQSEKAKSKANLPPPSLPPSLQPSLKLPPSLFELWRTSRPTRKLWWTGKLLRGRQITDLRPLLHLTPGTAALPFPPGAHA